MGLKVKAVREHVAVFKALADETRLRLLKLIVESAEAVCVCELADALGLPQYQVSKHLAVLRNEGLVEDVRTGTWVHYRPSAGTSALVDALYDLVREHVAGPVFDRDRDRLRLRLTLREEGRCVLGPNDPQVQLAFQRAGLAPSGPVLRRRSGGGARTPEGSE